MRHQLRRLVAASSARQALLGQLLDVAESAAGVLPLHLSSTAVATAARQHAISRCSLLQVRGFASSGVAAASAARHSRPVSGMPGGQSPASQGAYLVALVVGMVGLTYASVPLYRMFCQATGYGGTVKQGSTVEEKLRRRAEQADEALEAAAAAREVTVSFNADVTDGLNWRFVPTQRSVRISPGESTLAFYTAHNLSDRAVTGVSTYNVSPQQAGAYFNKIQCFCFEEQKLRPGEKVDMPVFFYIDPEFATDPRLKGTDHLTLSYTFFKVDEEEPEAEDSQEAAKAEPKNAAADSSAQPVAATA